MAKGESSLVLSGLELASMASDWGLSRRETEVVELLLQGLSDKQIARQLNISFGTERTHISRLFRKCGVHDRRQLIRIVFGNLRTLASPAADCENPSACKAKLDSLPEFPVEDR